MQFNPGCSIWLLPGSTTACLLPGVLVHLYKCYRLYLSRTSGLMQQGPMLVPECASAAAVLAMHHADWRSCEWTQKQGGHLAAPEGVAISLRAATILLLFPSRALTACISPSSLAMPCRRQTMFSCSFQQMSCKACYVQLHFSADGLQTGEMPGTVS